MGTTRAVSSSGFSPAASASHLYPLRKFSPSLFSRRIGECFFLKPRFIDGSRLREEIEVVIKERQEGYHLNGYLDLLILFAREKDELERIKRELKDNSPAALVAIPHSPPEFLELLSEWGKGEQHNGESRSPGEPEVTTAGILRAKLKNYVNQENLSFFWKGAETVPVERKGKNLFYGSLLENLFTRCFPFPLKIPDRKKVVREALMILLDAEKPLMFPIQGGSTAERLLKKFLTNLCASVSERGAYIKFEISDALPPESPLREHWHTMKTSLLDKSAGLKNLLRTFRDPPYGLSYYNLLLLSGAFWRVHGANLRLYGTSGKGRELMEINAANICAALQNPAGHEIVFLSHENIPSAFLWGISGIPDKGKVAGSLKECYASFSRWVTSLSPLTRDIMRNEGRDLRALCELFSETGDEGIIRDALFTGLPESQGMKDFDYENPDQVQELQRRLRNSLSRVEKLVDARRERMLLDLGRIFGVATPTQKIAPTQKILQKAMKDWFDTRQKVGMGTDFSEGTRSFWEVMTRARETDDLMFRELPQSWNMGESARWEKDTYLELSYRIIAAKLEIDSAGYRDFMEIKPGCVDKEAAQKLIIKYLDILEQDHQQKLFLLLNLAESVHLRTE